MVEKILDFKEKQIKIKLKLKYQLLNKCFKDYQRLSLYQEKEVTKKYITI